MSSPVTSTHSHTCPGCLAKWRCGELECFGCKHGYCEGCWPALRREIELQCRFNGLKKHRSAIAKVKKPIPKEVDSFYLQPTTSFPDGAPQRESYESDAFFYGACRKYDAEWVVAYKHPGHCKNLDCPQCFPNH